MSNQFLLRVTGKNIETYEQQNLVIVSSMVLNLTVKRTTVTDIDGNVYKTVKISNQWWMAENLKVTKYRNGGPIPNVTEDSVWANLSTGAYCDYNNDTNNVATYGRLYNWYAVNDSRNIAPEGWHVPSDEEWRQLEMALGMSQSDTDNTGFRGTDEGGKMKTTGTIEEGSGLWHSPIEGATNESGFSALPGGCREHFGYCDGMDYDAMLWSATESYDVFAWCRCMSRVSSAVYRHNHYKRSGFSVRCVRDY
jgi:uncharacterized protein (TIGR02145 family)